MTAIEFPFESVDKMTFEHQPQPLPANLRPVYRIVIILLILKVSCRATTASLLKIQFFNWVIKNSSLQELIKDNLPHQSVFTLALIHLDPMVNLALKYAVAEDLISVTSNSKYTLTIKGDEIATNVLSSDQSLLSNERAILTKIGQRVSEVKLRNELL